MSLALARRAVACKHWRWMPGMFVRYGDGTAWYRLTDGDGYGMPFRHVPPNPRDAWPDLSDPATLGCLLALVREAPGDPAAHCEQLFTGDWAVFDHTGGLVAKGLTEAEALVAALEAAGGEE